MRPAAILDRFDPTIRALALMAAVVPLAVSLSVVPPMWDDAHFLERAVCVNQTFFDFRNVRACLASMAKSPGMALLLLPAGPLTNGADQLGVATFALACCCFALAAWLGRLTFRARLPLAAVVAAAIAIALCRPLRSAAAPFLVDGGYAILVTIALLLPVLEIGAPTAPGRPAAWRGLLWGAVISLGMFAKGSFGLFAVATAPLIVLASLRRSGVPATRQKIFAALAVGALPAIVFIRNASMYLDLAWQSSFGGGAVFYGSAKPFWQSFSEIVATAGTAYWAICAGLLVVAVIDARRDPERLLIAVLGIGVALGYLILASLSQNEQSRFLWCVWVALPVLAAGAIAPSSAVQAPDTKMATAFILLVAVVASGPMFARFDLMPLREAGDLLRSLGAERPTRLVIASDPPFFNINTLQLAQRLDYDRLRNIDLHTVVYDKPEGRSLQYSTDQLLRAQFVVISEPDPAHAGPDFTNSLLPRYLDIARQCGRLVEKHPGPRTALLFDMRGTACPKPEAAAK